MAKIVLKKGNNGCLITLLIIAVIFGIFSAWMNIGIRIDDAKDETYIHEMSALLEDSYRCDASADKAVVYLTNEISDISIYTRGGFTTMFLPEGTSTEDAGQVRYLIYVNTQLVKVGEYYGGCDACRADYVISVVDLQSGAVIGKTTIEGFSPPYTTDKLGGSDHGDLPNDSSVTEWLMGII